MGGNSPNRDPDVALPFQAAFEDNELFEKVVKFFPYPVQVFSPDGTAIMIKWTASSSFLSSKKYTGQG